MMNKKEVVWHIKALLDYSEWQKEDIKKADYLSLDKRHSINGCLFLFYFKNWVPDIALKIILKLFRCNYMPQPFKTS